MRTLSQESRLAALSAVGVWLVFTPTLTAALPMSSGLLFLVLTLGISLGVVVVRRILYRAGLRLSDPGALAAQWVSLPGAAIDAVFPDPQADRGAEGRQAGQSGRIVGQSPTRPAPLLAVNALTYTDLCTVFDQENAALLAARARWSARRGAPPPVLVAGLEVLTLLGLLVPMQVLLWLLWVELQGGPRSVARLLAGGVVGGVLWVVVGLVLYGLLSAGVGVAAWLRAGWLSVQAEQDRAAAIRADEERRASAASLLTEMRRAGTPVREEAG